MANQRSTKSVSETTRASDTAPTAHRVSSIAHEAIDKASVKAEEIEERVRLQAGHLREKSSEAAREARAQFNESLTRLDAFVRERPLTALGIAFTAGIVGAALMRRNNSGGS